MEPTPCSSLCDPTHTVGSKSGVSPWHGAPRVTPSTQLMVFMRKPHELYYRAEAKQSGERHIKYKKGEKNLQKQCRFYGQTQHWEVFTMSMSGWSVNLLLWSQVFCDGHITVHDVTGSIVFMNLDARKEKLNFWFWIQEQFNNPGFERENSALVHCYPHVSSVREVILRALLVPPPLPSTRLVYLCFLQLNRLTLMSHRGEHARQLSISRTGKRESCIL